MTAPTAICQTQDGQVAEGNPCHLSAASAASGLGDWEYLARHVVPDGVQRDLRRRWDWNPGEVAVHDIRRAWGPVNLDFYPIEIHELPHRFVGRGFSGMPQLLPERMTPSELFHRVQQTFASLILEGADFSFYESLDGVRWDSDYPVGTVFHIEMEQRLPGGGEFNPDDGSVVCSEFATSPLGASSWIFSTVPTPRDNAHPVSGNRQFGLDVRRRGTVLPLMGSTDGARDAFPLSDTGFWLAPAQQDVYYIYTRGADRLTGMADVAAQLVAGLVFEGTRRVWQSFQRGVAAYVNGLGGRAVVPGYIERRWYWNRFAATHGIT